MARVSWVASGLVSTDTRGLSATPWRRHPSPNHLTRDPLPIPHLTQSGSRGTPSYLHLTRPEPSGSEDLPGRFTGTTEPPEKTVSNLGTPGQ